MISYKQDQGDEERTPLELLLLLPPSLTLFIPSPNAALIELPLKLTRERQLAIKLRKIFNDLGTEAASTMRKTGLAPNITNYHNELSKIIETDSLITADRFSKQFRQKIKLGNVGNGIIKNEIIEYVSKTSFDQAGYIIATTQKRLDQTIQKAFKDFAKLEIEPTKEQIAKVIDDNFKKINRGRSNSIAANEVQRVSEKSKSIEADALNRLGKIKKPKKMWDSILDAVTRPWHARANGQIVALEMPFTVKGELLMHPGDSSLGASLDNLINCRCSTQFISE